MEPQQSPGWPWGGDLPHASASAAHAQGEKLQDAWESEHGASRAWRVRRKHWLNQFTKEAPQVALWGRLLHPERGTGCRRKPALWEKHQQRSGGRALAE